MKGLTHCCSHCCLLFQNLILTMNLGSRLDRCYHPHFTEEETEAQWGGESLPAGTWGRRLFCKSASINLALEFWGGPKECFEWQSSFWLLRNDSKAPNRASLLGWAEALMEDISQIGNRLFSLTTEKNSISRPDGKRPTVLMKPRSPCLQPRLNWSPPSPPGAFTADPTRAHSLSLGSTLELAAGLSAIPPVYYPVVRAKSKSWKGDMLTAGLRKWGLLTDEWGTLIIIDTGKVKRRQNHWVFH